MIEGRTVSGHRPIPRAVCYCCRAHRSHSTDQPMERRRGVSALNTFNDKPHFICTVRYGVPRSRPCFSPFFFSGSLVLRFLSFSHFRSLFLELHSRLFLLIDSNGHVPDFLRRACASERLNTQIFEIRRYYTVLQRAHYTL